jgi:hypothetical protein
VTVVLLAGFINHKEREVMTSEETTLLIGICAIYTIATLSPIVALVYLLFILKKGNKQIK